MDFHPIFVKAQTKRFIVAGGGDAAVAKLRLLLKTCAQIDVYCTAPDPQVSLWAKNGALCLHQWALAETDVLNARLLYAANEDAVEDARCAAIGHRAGILVNIVDNLVASDFITPAIVDRDPVAVAIGTEGAAPVLARAIKADLEARLPRDLGILARLGKGFRALADRLPKGRARRDFWSRFYFEDGPRALANGDTQQAQAALHKLADESLVQKPRPAHVFFVGAGPGDPELLTLKARRILHEADVILYDRLVGAEILELARREALLIEMGKTGFGPSTAQNDINAAILAHAQNGAQIVRLKGGDATLFGRLDEEVETCEAAQIAYSIIPGITSASAAVASLGQSLTRRGRNSAVTLLTGHDVDGFADHDWQRLARPGSVAALYMGKKAARYVQGRLLMHGALPAQPVSLVENASRSDQRIVASTLQNFAQDLSTSKMSGPTLIFLGLAPRAAALAAQDNAQQKEFA